VLDMTRLTFIDATGLRSLVAAETLPVRVAFSSPPKSPSTAWSLAGDHRSAVHLLRRTALSSFGSTWRVLLTGPRLTTVGILCDPKSVLFVAEEL